MVVCWLMSATLASADPQGWTKVAERDGIRVEARSVVGSRVREIRATGDIDATPAACYAVIHAVADYPRTMPDLKAARVLRQEGDDVVWTYTRVEAPLVSARDYALRFSTTREADGTIRIAWTPANEAAPPLPRGVIRVEVNTGSWTLAPLDGGARTHATYHLLTDPGGSVTTWLAEQANKTAVPDVLRAVRKAARH